MDLTRKRLMERAGLLKEGRRVTFKGTIVNQLYNIIKSDSNPMIFADGKPYSIDAESMRNDLQNHVVMGTGEDGEEAEINVADIEFVELGGMSEGAIQEANEDDIPEEVPYWIKKAIQSGEFVRITPTTKLDKGNELLGLFNGVFYEVRKVQGDMYTIQDDAYGSNYRRKRDVLEMYFLVRKNK